MIETDGDKKIDELRSLLQRIDRVGSAAHKPRAEPVAPTAALLGPLAGPKRSPARGEVEAQLSPGASQLPAGMSQRDLLLAIEYRELLEGKRSTGLNPWVFVFATTLNTVVVATLAAIIVGMLRHDLVAQRPPPQSAYQAPPTPSPPLERGIRLAMVGTSDNPMRLEAGKPSPFPLRISPESATTVSYFLVITGLPRDAILTGAHRIGSDSWLIPPRASEQLSIIVPNSSEAPFPLRIQLRHTDGGAVAEAGGWLIVSEAAQESEKKAVSAPPGFLDRAEELLGRGDIVGARAIYQRAAEAGSAEAALSLGSTYDPNRLWGLGVFGMAGNRERARQWYSRADQLGNQEAKRRLIDLGN